jgi:hypothetical protein
MTERLRTSGRRLAQLAIVTVLVVGVPLASDAAEELRREAEDYTAYGSYDIGGEPIRSTYCSFASGARAVDGLDLPTEWFKLKVTFPHSGCYSSRIDYQSAYGDTVLLQVRLLDCPAPGQDQRAEYTLVNGYGFG